MFSAIGLFIGIFMILAGVIELVIRLVTGNTESYWDVATVDIGNLLLSVGLVSLMSLVITHGLLKDISMGAGMFKKKEVVTYTTTVIQSDKIIYLEK